MTIKFTNNASAQLASSISSGATSISVTTGQGALFPSLSGSDYFYATLSNSSNVLEIVKVTARTGDVLTVTRGQDGTTANAYSAGDKIELRPTAGGFNDIVSSVAAVSAAQAADASNITTLQAENRGPAFSAYQSSAQSIPSGTFTKVTCTVEEFDTNNNYDNATNYRFQPTVAGYYQIEGAVELVSSAVSMGATLYKNGTEFKRGVVSGTTINSGQGSTVSTLVQMNGTTDYVELYVYQASGAAISTAASSYYTYFQGFMARPA